MIGRLFKQPELHISRFCTLRLHKSRTNRVRFSQLSELTTHAYLYRERRVQDNDSPPLKAFPETCSLVVIRTYCPFWGRDLYDLWDDHIPIIPANNYLRSHLHQTEKTLQNKSYALVLFFRFLKRNGISFFDFDSKNFEPYVLLFRNELLLRARAGVFKDGYESDEQSGTSIGGISYRHAQSVMTEVGQLFVWWKLIEPPIYPISPRRKSLKSRNRLLPEIFQISVPSKNKNRAPNHVLEPSQVEAIWDYVTRVTRPKPPQLLIEDPKGPGKRWNARKVVAWNKACDTYSIQLAWFRRQQMLWALMLGSGMRVGEVPLVMLRDVVSSLDKWWVTLRVRRTTQHLGRAKTGPRIIFIGWDDRIATGVMNWQQVRQILIDRWMAKTGQPDHGMFLVNRDGGPLTVEGIYCFFDMLIKAFPILGGAFAEEQFRLHPHAIRHTVDSLFDDWGVPLDIRQSHLGHKHPETTQKYGRKYHESYKTAVIDARDHAAKKTKEQ
jgi:integrase